MGATEAILALASVKKVIDVVRFAADGDTLQWKAIGFTFLSWAVGTALVFLVAASSFAEGVGLADLGWADAILYGIGVGSAGSALHDASEGGVTIL